MNCYYTALPQEALLHVIGPDSQTFLQGQTTCDVNAVDDTNSVPGAYCTPQGRTVTDFLLCQTGNEHYALRLRRDLLQIAQSAFAKYIIFSKAKLYSDKDNWTIFALWGENVAQALAEFCPAMPAAQYASVNHEGVILTQLDEQGHQFECYVDADQQPLFADKVGAKAQLATEDSWRALQIRAGAGRVEQATTEAFIPQMLNYDFTGQLNFKKGCYTGQEVIARLHYRGKAKRRMYLMTMPTNAALIPGALLYSSTTEQSVGTVANCALESGELQVALVVATSAGIEAGLHLGSSEGPMLELAEQPYSLEK